MTRFPLEHVPGVDEKLQKRLEKAMKCYDYAKGDYLLVLGDLRAAGVSWETLTELTGETATELRRRLKELRRLEKVWATVDNM